MTLNITLLTSKIIYQSADYRLVDARTGQPLHIPSTKVVRLVDVDWIGFITYTGIGRVDNKHTSEFLGEWLEGVASPSFEEVVETIRNRASSWVRSIAQGKKHTFVVAAFVDGDPTAAVVSNFQKWHGAEFASISEEFVASTIVARRETEVVVTGIRDAVPRQQRRALKRLAANHSDDPARIRRALGEVNRIAAQRYPALISADCVVSSQDRNGRGHEVAIGDSRTQPITVMQGVNTSRITRSFVDQIYGTGKWTVKSVAFSRSPNERDSPPPCMPKLSDQPQTSGYRVIQLAMPNGQRATPRAVNAQGIVVGEGHLHWSGPRQPCVWPEPTAVEFLSLGGGYTGAAYDINDSGTIVGASEIPDRGSSACVWNLDGCRQDIGQALGRHSAAKKVNQNGDMVGWVSIHPTEGGQLHFRPAYWPSSGSPTILDNLAGRWGEGIDINTEGLMVIRVHLGLSPNACAWLWDGRNVRELGKPGPEYRAFWPCCLTDNRVVVGLTIRSDNQRGAAVRSEDGSWEFLFTPQRGREFTAAQGAQVIVGYDEINYYRVPWVKRDKADIHYLPHFQYHHHRPTIISEQGWILGTAATDKCCHPVLWVPE